MTDNPLQSATKTWIEAVQKYYELEQSLEKYYESLGFIKVGKSDTYVFI